VTPVNPKRIRAGSKGQLTNTESRQRNCEDGDPPTSPIEDPSAQNIFTSNVEDRTTGTITASGSTKLSLKIKERVAKHAAMKRQGKVMPLKNEDTESNFPGKPQTSKDLNPKGKTPPASSQAVFPPPREALKPKGSRRGSIPTKGQKRLSVRKEKPRLVTPAEYAQQLLDGAAKATEGRKSSVIKFLEGKKIFYIGGDMQYAGERTRGRMELVCCHF
jgi:DNA polymerase lambda